MLDLTLQSFLLPALPVTSDLHSLCALMSTFYSVCFVEIIDGIIVDAGLDFLFFSVDPPVYHRISNPPS